MPATDTEQPALLLNSHGHIHNKDINNKKNNPKTPITKFAYNEYDLSHALNIFLIFLELIQQQGLIKYLSKIEIACYQYVIAQVLTLQE